MPTKKTSYSAVETQQIAKELSQTIQNGVVSLTGDLGAGKTTFTQGFAQGLNIKEKIISPTFILIKQYPIPHTNKTLYHIDLYRLEDDINIYETGLKDIMDNPDNIVLIEWAEKISPHLPPNTIKINIEKIDEEKRIININ